MKQMQSCIFVLFLDRTQIEASNEKYLETDDKEVKKKILFLCIR